MAESDGKSSRRMAAEVDLASHSITLKEETADKLATLITPSEQVEELRGDISAADAKEGYLGSRQLVSFQMLQDAAIYIRFAVASYCAQKFREPSRFESGCAAKCQCCLACMGCCLGTSAPTEDIVRENILRYCGIPGEDLLYFSHDNIALAALPYIIALDREHKAVVVSIRGTMSVADLVTDAVFEPENIEEWLSPDVKRKIKRKSGMLAHAGIVSAAKAVLKDLESHGILQALIGGQDGQSTASSDPGSDAKDIGKSMQSKLDTKGWQLVLTGHSLGAGTAALMTLKLRERFPTAKCWAFSPPGGLLSKNLSKAMQPFCVSVACGKDAVPRANSTNLSRLVEEMVVSLARCRHHKLRVLLGTWWNKESRPPPDSLFHEYASIPMEARLTLSRYQKQLASRPKALVMYPPGRVIFMRPLKVLKTRRINRHKVGRRLEKSWDAVWVTPQELISEGILVSKQMMSDHLIDQVVLQSINYSLNHHPNNPHVVYAPRRRSSLDLPQNPSRENSHQLSEIAVEQP